MNLRSVDLNLLVALEALLTERHVTRAAERIGLSQPATSNALSRLRHIFNDDLLIRTAVGMQPTERALELLEPTRQVLRQIERVFSTDAAFNAREATRVFTVRLSDLLSLLLLPGLLDLREKGAPKISFDVVHLPPRRTVDALEMDELDVAVSTGLEHTSSIRSEVLLQDRMVCVMRRDHPAARRKLTLARFLKQGHLKISMSPTDLRFVDDVLARSKLRRTVIVNVPHWLIVPHVLARTDLVSVMPERLARAIASKELTSRDVPFAAKPFDWSVYWHRRHDNNAAIRWLRDQLRVVSQALS